MLKYESLEYSAVQLFHSSRESEQEFWLRLSQGHLKCFSHSPLPSWIIYSREMWDVLCILLLCVCVCVCEVNMDGGPPFRLPYLISLKILINKLASLQLMQRSLAHSPWNSSYTQDTRNKAKWWQAGPASKQSFASFEIWQKGFPAQCFLWINIICLYQPRHKVNRKKRS